MANERNGIEVGQVWRVRNGEWISGITKFMIIGIDEDSMFDIEVEILDGMEYAIRRRIDGLTSMIILKTCEIDKSYEAVRQFDVELKELLKDG
jgi:hypothetical protein